MKEKLIIVGMGGHGKVVADIAMAMDQWKEIVFLDDDSSRFERETPFNLEFKGGVEQVYTYLTSHDIVVAIGSNERRASIQSKLESQGASLAVIRHPRAVVGECVEIKGGTVIMAGVVINSYTRIGRGCIINTGATVDHDNRLGDYVHISPGVNLAGGVSIGDQSWLGIGASVSNDVSIGQGVTVGAGGLVLKNIYEAGTYVGLPVFKLR